MKRWILLAVALLVWTASQGDAADPNAKTKKKAAAKVAEVPKVDAPGFIKRFDKNNDDALGKEEITSQAQAAAVLSMDRSTKDGRFTPDKMFAIFDLNKDGKLNEDELDRALRAARNSQVTRYVEKQLERMDKNKDGKIAKGEVVGLLADGFAGDDLNGDGVLDRQELTRHAEWLMVVLQQGDIRFDQLDADKDGKLTAEELKGTPLSAKFAALDADKDGRITPEEYDAFFNKKAD